MKLILIASFLLLALTSLAQPAITKLNEKNIPKTIKYNGKIVHAVSWKDSNGDNIVLLAATGETKSKNATDEDARDATLYAYHYLLSGDSAVLQWKLQDYLKECSFDIVLNFIEKAFAVTDLNKDGKPEVWIMYKNACVSDVSPVPTKLIMYENNKKYATRGTSKGQISETSFEGGEYSFDDALKKAPVAFRQHAEKLWKQYAADNWAQ